MEKRDVGVLAKAFGQIMDGTTDHIQPLAATHLNLSWRKVDSPQLAFRKHSAERAQKRAISWPDLKYPGALTNTFCIDGATQAGGFGCDPHPQLSAIECGARG